MTDTTLTTTPQAPSPAVEAPVAGDGGSAPVPPAVPVAPAPGGAPGRSRTWMGVVILFVAVATLAGATVALFVRVQEAQQTADDAVVLAGNLDALSSRVDDVDATLASMQDQGTTTADDVAAARDQVGALRKCVNNAIDAWAQATQSGKPASITKC